MSKGEKKEMRQEYSFGFKYRGNFYGFWATYEEATLRAHEKRINDKSGFVEIFGVPPAHIWECDKDRYPRKLIGIEK